jgi:hypothetical protein|tara:strand:- start:858 stop:1301 length:444 start_codon:yes stop_codon:yes gene_type:complete
MEKNNIPIPSGYNVYWEKWVDAYEADIETELENKAIEKDDTGLFFEGFSEEESESVKSIQTIFTPFGIMPLTEHSLASTYFKFWVGHSNFKITAAAHSLISKVEGVESLDIFTPYRFRIAVGKLFRDRDVMSNVKDVMVSHVRKSQQ